MWRLFAFGGIMAHAAAGTWPMISSASQGHPVSWGTVVVNAFAPGLAGLALTALFTLTGKPSHFPSPIEHKA